jgi:hypothetical protein
MSRKDYVAMAEVIKREIDAATNTRQARSISNIARGMADTFKRDNSRFDRVRFYHACGLDDNGNMEGLSER